MQVTWKMHARYLLRDTWIWQRLMGMREKRQARTWVKAGRFGPPHVVKQQMIRDFAERFHATTLIETGTFLGDMVYAMKDQFKSIYSIELSQELYDRARKSFEKYPHIHLIAGDSATELKNVLANIQGRCLFWLDGHYSGGITALGKERCPIRGEIQAILQFADEKPVILVDDAICFDGSHGYPTLFELHDVVTSRLAGYQMTILDNVIQIFPQIA